MIKKIVSLVLCICILSVSIPVMAKDRQVRSPIYDEPASAYFDDGWRMIQSPITATRTWNSMTVTEENVRDILIAALSGAYNGFLGWSVVLNTCLNRYIDKPDFESVGGVYSRTYLIATPVYAGDKAPHINVPVACKTKRVTFFYESPLMRSRDIMFVKRFDDINQLLPWYRYQDTSVGWQ
jgi:hypothetical protein